VGRLPDRRGAPRRFLLAAHLDAAFDAALMTIDEEGGLLWSSKLSEKAKSILKDGNVKQIRLAPAHRAYLAHHYARFHVQEAI
jgi:putative restriction endonuclease